jgi:hypothetical protein
MIDADVAVITLSRIEWDVKNIGSVALHMLEHGRSVTVEGEVEKEKGTVTITPELKLSTSGRVFEPLAAYVRSVLEQVGHSSRGCSCCVPRGCCELPDFDYRF